MAQATDAAYLVFLSSRSRQIKVTSLWQLEEDQLVPKPELLRTEDFELREQLSQFLSSGSWVLRAPGLREDRLDSSKPDSVPLGYSTDGQWLWPAELSYYLKEYGLLPDFKFLQHIYQCDFRAKQAEPEQLQEALNLLSGHPAISWGTGL